MIKIVIFHIISKFLDYSQQIATHHKSCPDGVRLGRRVEQAVRAKNLRFKCWLIPTFFVSPWLGKKAKERIPTGGRSTRLEYLRWKLGHQKIGSKKLNHTITPKHDDWFDDQIARDTWNFHFRVFRYLCGVYSTNEWPEFRSEQKPEWKPFQSFLLRSARPKDDRYSICMAATVFDCPIATTCLVEILV